MTLNDKITPINGNTPSIPNWFKRNWKIITSAGIALTALSYLTIKTISYARAMNKLESLFLEIADKNHNGNLEFSENEFLRNEVFQPFGIYDKNWKPNGKPHLYSIDFVYENGDRVSRQDLVKVCQEYLRKQQKLGQPDSL